MAESADATDSNSVARKGVRVQVPLRALSRQIKIEYGVEAERARINSAILVTIFDSTFTPMDDEVLVQDWLWDDDSPEESEDEQPLSQSELALRKRMISIFIGTVIGVIVLVAFITIVFKVFSSSSSNQIPNGCLRGKISECPSDKKPSSVTLPGGLKWEDFNSDLPKGPSSVTLPGGVKWEDFKSDLPKDNAKILEKCLNGDVEACAAMDSRR